MQQNCILLIYVTLDLPQQFSTNADDDAFFVESMQEYSLAVQLCVECLQNYLFVVRHGRKNTKRLSNIYCNKNELKQNM